jgi:hypothetical protein
MRWGGMEMLGTGASLAENVGGSLLGLVVCERVAGEVTGGWRRERRDRRAARV